MLVGIDLGTTNSLIAVWRDGRAELVANALGKVLTPSVVSLDDQDTVIVGAAARDRLLTHPDRTAAAFKRYMGTHREIRLGTRAFRPEELSALVLRSLKADVEAAFGEPIHEAIITVPAYFNDAQRKATRAAGELAGLRVERLLNEPTAAALAYGLHQRDRDNRFLIFDLGGGTFDVSLLELFDGVMEVHASAGDNFLGGEDFVEVIVNDFTITTNSEALYKNDPTFSAQLRERAERAKRQLTNDHHAEITLRADDRDLQWKIDEAGFARVAQPLLDRLRTPVERALRDAKLRAADLNEIVLVGGATRMPIVRRLASQMFGRIPASNIDPDTVVAVGAAVQAGLKARDAALADVVMTDVAPYTMGIEVVEHTGESTFDPGHFLPIIERNTVIPVSRVKSVSPVHARQSVLNVTVYQGESRLVKNNIKLGELNLKLPKSTDARNVAVDVRFTYDLNGLLEVETVTEGGQGRQRLVIEGNPGVLGREEIEKRFAALDKLKVHPRDQAENRAAMSRAERIYEELLGDARTTVGYWIARFERSLATQDSRLIDKERREFLAALDEIEGEPYL